MARLTILTPEEINTLYALPTLDDEERACLFTLEADDRVIIDGFGDNTARKVNYILQLGYCRATHNFFTFSIQQVKLDVDFIMQAYFRMKRILKSSCRKTSITVTAVW